MFFTDYKWDLSRLDSSVAFAKDKGCLNKLLTGIDVFGRGSYLGGKW
jgi:hypothetical protein